MALSAEEIVVAVKMHDSVQGFEKQLRASGWSSAMAGIGIGVSMNSGRVFRAANSHERIFIVVGFLAAVALLLFIRRMAFARYKRDQILLHILEREHANELPWIAAGRQEEQVKEHLAAVRQIQQEIAHSHV